MTKNIKKKKKTDTCFKIYLTWYLSALMSRQVDLKILHCCLAWLPMHIAYHIHLLYCFFLSSFSTYCSSLSANFPLSFPIKIPNPKKEIATSTLNCLNAAIWRWTTLDQFKENFRTNVSYWNNQCMPTTLFPLLLPSSAALYWCPSSPNSLIADDEFTTMMPRQEIPLLKYYILVLIHKVRGPSNHLFRLGLHAIKSLLALEASEVRTYAYTL